MMLARMSDEDVRTAVREMIRAHGEKETVRRLGMPRATLARLASGLPVREGTLLLARVRAGLPMAPATLRDAEVRHE